MTTESLLEQAVQLVGARAAGQNTPEPGRIDLTVEPGNLLASLQSLVAAHWGYLSAITGLDLGPEAGRMEVLYQICHAAAVLTLRVPVARENPVVPSVCGIIPAASFFERELIEMFGVVCEGTPDARRLFISDDWPEGVFPLRKDFIVPAPPPQPEG
jgi:Ni,Fe-hydrogenase III component G